jgi:protein AATF/BFR2
MGKRDIINKIFNENDSDEGIDIDDDFNDEIVKMEHKKYEKFSAKKTDEIKAAMEKYKGKKVNYEDMNSDEDESIDEDGENFEDEEIEDSENFENQEGSEIEEENIDQEELDDQVEQDDQDDEKNQNENSDTENRDMDKEDEDYLKKITHHTPNEIRKGKNVINQKNLFDFFISMRISLQKIILGINSLPQGETLKKYIDESNINVVKYTISDFLKLLTTFVTFQKELLKKNNYFESLSQSSLVLEEINKITKAINQYNDELLEQDQLNVNKVDEIIKQIVPIGDKLNSILEKIINIWYRKTLVYSYKANTGNKILKILNNNFCEHIKKNIESNYDNIRHKSQKKSGEKVLGKRNRPMTDEFDEEVFNDNDFYNFILKEFISNKEDMINADNTNNSRMDLTLQYLLNRSKQKKDKNVDTRASKNRKLRFDKHEKIINFMVPIPNHKVVSGRDEILNSIFGIGKKRRDTDGDVDSDFEII